MTAFVNKTAAFERAVKMLEEIRAAAKAGDEYAIKLLSLYDAAHPGVLGMPWPEKKSNGPAKA